jgi:hypothetical protein
MIQAYPAHPNFQISAGAMALRRVHPFHLIAGPGNGHFAEFIWQSSRSTRLTGGPSAHFAPENGWLVERVNPSHSQHLSLTDSAPHHRLIVENACLLKVGRFNGRAVRQALRHRKLAIGQEERVSLRNTPAIRKTEIESRP